MANPPRRRLWPWIGGAVGALAAALAITAATAAATQDGVRGVAAVVAPSSASPNPSVSRAKLDMKATCVLAVPAMTTATELIGAFTVAYDQRKMSTLDATKYRESAKELRAIAEIAAPALVEPMTTVASVVARLGVIIRAGGSYELDYDRVKVAGFGLAEACRPYADR